MKTSYTIILVLAIATVVLFTSLACWAVEKEEENIWHADSPKLYHERFELTDEAIERAMERLKETNPERAEELKKLREKEPEEFKAELRKVMRERFGKRLREQKWPIVHGVKPSELTMEQTRERIRERRERGTRMRERYAEYLEWLEENYPEEAEKLAGLKEEKPELYMRQFPLSYKKYRRIFEASEEKPKLVEFLKEDLELKEKRDKLLRKIRAVREDERKELVKELENVVSSRFDLIVKRKQIVYEQLRKELEELKNRVKKSESEVEKWKKVKGEKVKERLEELISRAEKFRWD